MLVDDVGAQTTPCGYWVPACAGTTDGEWRVVGGGRGDNVSVVLCGRRDPYAVSLVLRDAVGRHQSQNYPLWLWVPACAGTTDREWRHGKLFQPSLLRQTQSVCACERSEA